MILKVLANARKLYPDRHVNLLQDVGAAYARELKNLRCLNCAVNNSMKALKMFIDGGSPCRYDDLSSGMRGICLAAVYKLHSSSD